MDKVFKGLTFKSGFCIGLVIGAITIILFFYQFFDSSVCSVFCADGVYQMLVSNNDVKEIVKTNKKCIE